MGDLVLASMVPEYNGNGWVILETIPNLYNGGLWLGMAAWLLVIVVLRNKLRHRGCASEQRGVD